MPETKQRTANPPVVVTTSWDDDDRSGLKIAKLLRSKHLPGTFYVQSGRLKEGTHLTAPDLRGMAADGFEIGGHTVSHRLLTDLDLPDLVREVGECKQVLQDATGREVTSFCYPRGRFNAAVVREVKRAGYHGARSTLMLSSGKEFDRFEMPTTVQAYPHRRMNYVRNLVRLQAYPALLKSATDLLRFEGWLQLGKMMFDRVLRKGGIWHLYGHPWEIERLNLWSQLAEMLDYVANRSDVTYATNGQLFSPFKPVIEPEKVATLVH